MLAKKIVFRTGEMTQGVKVLLLSLNDLSWIAGDPRQCKEKSHSLMLFSIFNPRTVAHAVPPPLPPQKGKKQRSSKKAANSK